MFTREVFSSRWTRVEVYRNGQTLLLKHGDITVDRLARVFKVNGLFMYAEGTIKAGVLNKCSFCPRYFDNGKVDIQVSS